MLAIETIDTLVTTRADGNLGDNVGDDPAVVAANRARAAAALGCAPGDVVWARQVHGREVAVVDGPVAPESLAVDALVTTTPGLGLAIKVADCTPLWLHDPGAGVLGVVHAGWRGTAARVAEAAVAALAGVGADPGRIVAGIGPTIGAADYQVGEEVADAASAAGLAAALTPDGPGHWTFDLVAANRRVLTDAGVPAANIGASGAVTGPGTPYYSHRAEAPCGRFALLARLRDR